MISEPSPRAKYVLEHYRLETIVDASTVVGYRAVMLLSSGEVFRTIEGTRREAVIRQARAWWGHFNYRDEAEAFSRIFPPSYA